MILGYNSIGAITARYFRKITKGVITLGKRVEKKVVTHKRYTETRTACGISLHDVAKSNATWRGVTCLRCEAVRNKKTNKVHIRKTTKIGAYA